jgi:GT2 family glycosyltransferase
MYRKLRRLPDAVTPQSEIAAKLVPPKEQRRLVFPVAEAPLVSIIIPVHNQFDYTYTCLKSILDVCGDSSYEVIVGDDASTDKTRKIAKYASGIKVVRNEEPLLFLRNCNHAVSQSRGAFLVFLNNDTIVHEDWLASMLRLIQADPSAGIIGSKLLFANGALQEAGGIIWSDASGWNYGRGGDPEASEHNYVKEVDYVSGCSLLIRKSLWDEIGGFDERFVPAYYEDADLAFQARGRGYKTLYQPESVVTHFEGVSHGTDLESGLKAYQKKNHAVFLEKWRAVLEAEQSEPSSDLFRARDRSQRKKTLVLVDHYVPTFDKDAGSRMIFEYTKLFLRMGYRVVFIPDNYNRAERYTAILQQMGVEVLYGPWYFHNWEDWLVENKDCFDVFFLSRPHISVKYIDHILEHTDAVVLYCGHDLHFLREERQYEITRDPKLLVSLEEWKELELALIQKADCSLYPSFEEENYVKSLIEGARVVTYPIYIFSDLAKSDYRIGERRDLLFVGGFGHPPNGDAMIWFLDEIFPAIQKARPAIRLHIVGGNPSADLAERETESILLHGFVSDAELDRMYGNTRLVVAPLRYGAGIKGKVVESMSKGVPIVTTSIGAEGFLEPGGYLAVRDDPAEFSQRVLELYEDEKTLAQMVAESYAYLERHFSEKNAQDVIRRALEHSKHLRP